MIDELFEKVVAEEREILIEDLGLKLSEMKGNMVLYESTIKRLKEENGVLQNELNNKDQ